jgi:hypothetical protein
MKFRAKEEALSRELEEARAEIAELSEARDEIEMTKVAFSPAFKAEFDAPIEKSLNRLKATLSTAVEDLDGDDLSRFETMISAIELALDSPSEGFAIKIDKALSRSGLGETVKAIISAKCVEVGEAKMKKAEAIEDAAKGSKSVYDKRRAKFSSVPYGKIIDADRVEFGLDSMILAVPEEHENEKGKRSSVIAAREATKKSVEKDLLDAVSTGSLPRGLANVIHNGLNVPILLAIIHQMKEINDDLKGRVPAKTKNRRSAAEDIIKSRGGAARGSNFRSSILRNFK